MALFLSNSRVSGTVNNFKIKFDDPLEDLKQFRIEWVRIPYTFYNVRSINNTIDFTDVGGPHTATVLPGQYTLNELITALVVAMDLVSVVNFTITFDPNNLKVTITGDAGFTLNLSTSTMNKLLGFGDTDTIFASSHISDGAANIFAGTDSLLIKSNRLRIRHKVRIRQEESDTLISVPICVNAGTLICYQQELDHFHTVGTRREISELDFRLEFPSGEQVDLNGSEWSFYANMAFYRPAQHGEILR